MAWICYGSADRLHVREIAFPLGGACHVVAAGWLHTAGSKRSCLGSPRLRLPPATWSQDPYRPLDTGFGIGLLVPLGGHVLIVIQEGQAAHKSWLVSMFEVTWPLVVCRVRERIPAARMPPQISWSAGPHFAAAAKFPCSVKSLLIKETVVLKL